MDRINIIGPTGAGKSTLARALATHAQCANIDLDALYWRPGWVPEASDVFRAKVMAALVESRWAASGNYASVRELIWSRADTVIWLDYPLPLTLYRLTLRTLSGLVTKREILPGCRETIRNTLLARDGLFLFALRTYRKRRARILADLASARYASVRLHRFTRPQDTAAWLATIDHSVFS